MDNYYNVNRRVVRNILMQKKSLSKTNPYLKNPAERRAMLYTSVVTSSAIEGIHLPHISDEQNATWAVALSPDKSRKTTKKKKPAVTCHESESSYRSRR
jgi:hypothetical protein